MENLVILRKQHNKTQSYIAKMLNISQSTYATYENGTREPSIETLIKLADFYNVSIDYLVGYKKYIELIPANTKELIKNYNLLDDRKKRLVDYYVEAMLDIENKEKKMLK